MMTGPNHEPEDVENAETRPISVAELLAKNGNIGSPPVTGRRRRRRGNSDAVTVAELTGEIPVITDAEDAEDDQDDADDVDDADDADDVDEQDADVADVDVGNDAAGPAADRPPQAEESDGSEQTDDADGAVHWLDSAPRFPKSPPQQPDRESGPKRSSYPGPQRPAGADQIGADEREQSTREQPDTADADADTADAPDADAPDVDDPGSGRLSLRRILFGKRVGPPRQDGAGDHNDGRDRETPRNAGAGIDAGAGADAGDTEIGDTEIGDTDTADEAPTQRPPGPVGSRLGHGSMVVLESMLAVVVGAGLFVAFDQLWQWNNIVALVLSVLVTLGLVAAVQVVRKTVDTTSTLIAVAVGLLITLGPLALLRSV